MAKLKARNLSTDQWMLVAENDALIWYWIRRLGIPALHEDMAFHVGMKALEAAAMSFDLSRGYRFSTYASACIRRRLLTQAVQQQGNRDSKLRRCGVDVTELRLAGRDDPAMEAEAAEELAIQWNLVRRLVSKLQPRMREVITRRFGLGHRGIETYAAIAKTMGVSKQRIQQIEGAALWTMRRMAAGRCYAEAS